MEKISVIQSNTPRSSNSRRLSVFCSFIIRRLRYHSTVFTRFTAILRSLRIKYSRAALICSSVEIFSISNSGISGAAPPIFAVCLSFSSSGVSDLLKSIASCCSPLGPSIAFGAANLMPIISATSLSGMI